MLEEQVAIEGYAAAGSHAAIEGYAAVAAAEDLWDGEMESHDVDGNEILLIRIDGCFHAYRGSCPHQSQPLVDGDLDGTTLTCSAHEWMFDARTGQGINPRGSSLTRHDVRVVDGVVMVSRAPVVTLPVH